MLPCVEAAQQAKICHSGAVFCRRVKNTTYYLKGREDMTVVKRRGVVTTLSVGGGGQKLHDVMTGFSPFGQ